MKPYFAKYLPVEGDINDGTKVMFKINGKWTEPCDFDSYIGPQIEDAKQGKLFLCSRDIQVGDNIYLTHANEYGVFKYQRPDGRIICEPTRTIWPDEWDKQEYFKVIGEISPDATWVTEEMEFDRNDFEMRWVNSIGKYSLSMKEVDTEEETPILKAFIKGPCEHFH